MKLSKFLRVVINANEDFIFLSKILTQSMCARYDILDPYIPFVRILFSLPPILPN